MKKRAGFTLIEMMVTVVVLGIIISIAIPKYMTQVEKMRGAEARSICYQAYAGYQRLVADGETINASNNVTWRRLGMSDPNLNPNRYFDYVLQGGSNPTFFRGNRIGSGGTQWVRVRRSTGVLSKTAPY